MLFDEEAASPTIVPPIANNTNTTHAVASPLQGVTTEKETEESSVERALRAAWESQERQIAAIEEEQSRWEGDTEERRDDRTTFTSRRVTAPQTRKRKPSSSAAMASSSFSSAMPTASLLKHRPATANNSAAAGDGVANGPSKHQQQHCRSPTRAPIQGGAPHIIVASDDAELFTSCAPADCDTSVATTTISSIGGHTDDMSGGETSLVFDGGNGNGDHDESCEKQARDQIFGVNTHTNRKKALRFAEDDDELQTIVHVKTDLSLSYFGGDAHYLDPNEWGASSSSSVGHHGADGGSHDDKENSVGAGNVNYEYDAAGNYIPRASVNLFHKGGSAALDALTRQRMRSAIILPSMTKTIPPTSCETENDSEQQPQLSSSHLQQQAFSIFAIPFIVNSKSLSVRELKEELSARGLSTAGTREVLARRLDRHVRTQEAELVVADDHTNNNNSGNPKNDTTISDSQQNDESQEEEADRFHVPDDDAKRKQTPSSSKQVSFKRVRETFLSSLHHTTTLSPLSSDAKALVRNLSGAGGDSGNADRTIKALIGGNESRRGRDAKPSALSSSKRNTTVRGRLASAADAVDSFLASI